MARTDKTPYATACDVSREMALNLSNGEVEALADFLAGFEDQDAALRDVLRGGREKARELLQELRAA